MQRAETRREAPPAARDSEPVASTEQNQQPDAPASTSNGAGSLEERLAEACGPRLRTMLSRVKVEQVGSDEFELSPEPNQRAMVEAHLGELKPVFEKALGMRGVSLRLCALVGPAALDGDAEPEPVIRSNNDAELEHPLVKEVASLFGATPKSVQPRGKRG